MSNPEDIPRAYYAAMQRGADAVDDLSALFALDAEYIEPFSGEVRRHVGRAAIRANFEASMKNRPPDLKLSVDRVVVDGEEVIVEWTCESPAFEAPIRGRDRYVVRDGAIMVLETTFVQV